MGQTLDGPNPGPQRVFLGQYDESRFYIILNWLYQYSVFIRLNLNCYKPYIIFIDPNFYCQAPRLKPQLEFVNALMNIGKKLQHLPTKEFRSNYAYKNHSYIIYIYNVI